MEELKVIQVIEAPKKQDGTPLYYQRIKAEDEFHIDYDEPIYYMGLLSDGRLVPMTVITDDMSMYGFSAGLFEMHRHE